MSFKRNDIVSKQRLRDALEEETAMGFAHNDIVTTYAMDKAIAEGGGGGGGDTGTTWHVIVNAVPMADTSLTAQYIENEADYGNHVEVCPYYNGEPYTTFYTSVSEGLTNFALDLWVSDEYDGSLPAQIKVYYSAAYTAEVTGNITMEHDEYDFIFTITGDGTITITDA